ncbi:MAG: YfhO family protein [Acidimicrobiaceae bacterium]|nr:YfhO family protein [Acidimicrobiaceae bacterium]
MESSLVTTASNPVTRLAHRIRTLLGRVSQPANALLPLSNDYVDRRRLRGHHSLVVVAVLFNLWSLRLERLSVAYPNDSGMHLQMTTLAMRLLRQGISPLDHWYPMLSLGSAFFVQYQSFSALVTGAISLIFGPQATFAWSLYLLLSLWPLCVYWSTRLLSWGRYESAVAAALSPLLFTVTGRGFGHQSYIWIGSGLWSQLWAMWTLPLAWAFSWRFISQRKSLFPAVLTLTLTIAFHFLTAYLAALTLAVWILIRPSQFLVRSGRALILGVGALMAAAWVTVPLLVHAKWLAINQFQVGTTINDSYGARRVLSWLLTGQIYDWRRWPIITILVGVGLLSCQRRWRYDERARAIVGAWLLSLILFFGRPTLGPLLNLLPGNQNLLLQRYIMGVQLAGLVLAGVGALTLAVFLYRASARLTRQRFATSRCPALPSSPWLRTPLLLAVIVALLAPAWTQISTYDGYSAAWISYQRQVATSQGAEVDSLVTLAQARGGGRIYAGMPSNWGHQFYVGAVPVYIYLEQLNVDAVGFTLRTSGLMTDPEAYFDEFVIGDYATFGVRYVLLPVGHAPPVPATLLRTEGRYRLWQVGSAPASALFQLVDTYGIISANNADLGTRTSTFLRSSWPARAIYPIISYDGHTGATPTLTSLANQKGVAGKILTQSQDLVYAQSARATVVANRRAVVLLKVAYDPGWRVSVDGRSARTIMLAPALLGVSVSPGRHVVIFTYRGYSHYNVLYATAVLTLVGAALLPWWRRRSTSKG